MASGPRLDLVDVSCFPSQASPASSDAEDEAGTSGSPAEAAAAPEPRSGGGSGSQQKRKGRSRPKAVEPSDDEADEAEEVSMDQRTSPEVLSMVTPTLTSLLTRVVKSSLLPHSTSIDALIPCTHDCCNIRASMHFGCRSLLSGWMLMRRTRSQCPRDARSARTEGRLLGQCSVTRWLLVQRVDGLDGAVVLTRVQHLTDGQFCFQGTWNTFMNVFQAKFVQMN